tara:strand:- start:283 stop:447 length:165 start_codon:yes stop_codon:yes gene_type:complete
VIFAVFVGVAPDHVAKVRLLEMIVQVNEKHPHTYLSAGINNAVDSFCKSCSCGA